MYPHKQVDRNKGFEIFFPRHSKNILLYELEFVRYFMIPVVKSFNIVTSGILNLQEGIQFHLSFYWRNKANIEFPLFVQIDI